MKKITALLIMIISIMSIYMLEANASNDDYKTFNETRNLDINGLANMEL